MGLVTGFVVAAAVALLALLLNLNPSGGRLWIGGPIFFALAVWFYFWNFEKDAVFADDWVEIGQIAASAACALAGLGFLIAYLLA